jgi:NitT/TauT family transport system permease protein
MDPERLPQSKAGRRRLVDYLIPREPIPARVYIGLGVASLGTVLLVWSLLTYGGFIAPLFLPTPHRVLAAGLEQFASFGFATDIFMSTYRVLAGFLLAAVIGVPLGLLMGTFKAVEALIEPLVGFIRYMPASAFIPLFILWLGIGDVEKIAIIFVGSVFQLILMIAVVASSVPKELLETAYTLGAGRLQVIRRVLLPASLPGIMDTLRIIVGWAWTYIIVAELVAAESGIGYMIINAQRMLQTGSIIFGILSIGLLGILTDYAFKWMHRWLFPWAA